MNLSRKTLLFSLAAMMADMGKTLAKVHNEEPNKRGYRSAAKSTFTPEQNKKRNKNKASKKARKKNRR